MYFSTKKDVDFKSVKPHLWIHKIKCHNSDEILHCYYYYDYN